jgi:hypothetical protein
MNKTPAARFREIYELLVGAKIEFLLVGGAAANLLGSPRFTLDVDIAYSRRDENIAKIVSAFGTIHPYLRGAPAGLPFQFDAQTIRNGLNFTLITDLGPIDLLGEVPGGGTYEQLLPFSEVKNVYGLALRCVTLEKLIELKRAAGRPRDQELIAELEIIRQEQRQLKKEKQA